MHSDSGTQFGNLGDLGTHEESGESLKLLILLEAQSISPANGQKLNAAEPAIKRIKARWQTIFKDIKNLPTLSVLNLHLNDLNRVPVSPSQSHIAPIDLLNGYKAIPLCPQC